MEADAGGTLARLARTKDDARRRARRSRRWRGCATTRGPAQPRAGVGRVRQGARHDRRVGRRAALGVRRVPRRPPGVDGQHLQLESAAVEALRARVEDLTRRRGRRPRMLVGKPGLDGHSNGAEMIAVAARHGGFEVVYSGIRLSAAEIARQAAEEDATSSASRSCPARTSRSRASCSTRWRPRARARSRSWSAASCRPTTRRR